MPVSASFDIGLSPDADFFWYDHLKEDVLPYRMSNGYAGSWFLFLNAAMAQSLEQLARDAMYIRQLKYNENPDSEVTSLLGTSLGVLKYDNDTDKTYRDRVVSFWDNAASYGTESRLIEELGNAGAISSSIKFNLAGTALPVSAPKAGSDYNIKPYPNSNDWPSQFSIIIDYTDNFNSHVTGSESDFVSDEFIRDVRTIIAHTKPNNWVAREIIIVSGSTGNYWGDGSKWGDGTTWGNTGSISSERHAAKLG